MIYSHVKADDILTSEYSSFDSIFLSLQLHLNCCCIIETSFDVLWSSAILGNLRKMFRNVCVVFGQILENRRKFSENRQNRFVLRMFYIIKRKLHGRLGISSRVEIRFSTRKDKFRISACFVLSIYLSAGI